MSGSELDSMLTELGQTQPQPEPEPKTTQPVKMPEAGYAMPGAPETFETEGVSNLP
jgi:hypothetical protein